MTLSLSRIYMPFNYRKNPAFDRLDAISSPATHSKPDEHVDEAKILSAFLFPHVSPTKLAIFTNLVLFCFRCRDLIETCRRGEIDKDRLTEILDTCIEIFQTGMLPTSRALQPLHLFALEVQQDLASLQTPDQRQRLARTIAEHLRRGALPLLELELSGETPGIRAYRECRHYDVALHVLIELCELAGDIELGDLALFDPILRRMRREACLQIALANDILSSHATEPEDSARSPQEGPSEPWNMVDIVTRQRGVGREQASLEVVEMINHQMWTFIELERKLPDWAPATVDDVQLYLRGIKDLMGGHWYWSLEGTHYQSPTSAFAELRRSPRLTLPARPLHSPQDSLPKTAARWLPHPA